MNHVSYDVIVIGLGGMGSAAAFHLADRGQRVLGLEKFTPAHDKGSSHGGSRIIRQSYFEDPAYVPLLLRSYELWDELRSMSGKEVHRITGGLFLGRESSVTFSGSLLASRQWSLPHEILDAAQVREAFPTFDPDPDEVALFEAAAGFARPELTVQAHLDLAENRGATLQFGETVLGWEESGDGVTVTTDKGTHTAGQVVICPGAWAPQLLEQFAVPIVVERQVLHWFGASAGTAAYENNPIFIHEAADGMQDYGFPAIDGPDGGVKVALLPQGHRVHAGHHRPYGAPARDRGDADPGAADGARPRRAERALRDVHVLQHSGRALRHRAAPRRHQRHRRVRVLRPRFQVRARRR
ncbi:sarcosine oxidase [Rhodococcus sp. SORGH_AS 301]|nr:sarcosine oxidase [Rhodococcus sp. SORGH_AS_0301]